MRLVLSLGVSFLLFSSVAAAQHAPRGTIIGTSAGAAGIGVSGVPAGTRVFTAGPSVRVSGSRRPSRTQVAGEEFSSFGTFPVQTVRFDNVPGLGFDYPHLAAVTRGQPRQRSNFERSASLGFQEVFFSPLGATPTIVIVQQPPVMEVPEYPRAAGYSESLPDNESEIDARTPRSPRPEPAPARTRTQAETSPAEATPAPQADSAQYVFVQRDGSLLFAVAYSWDKGLLRYITPEGLKRSIVRDKLDLDATQQFNEQRGLDFRFPT